MRTLALPAAVSVLSFVTCLASCRSVGRSESPSDFDGTVGTWEGVRRDVADGRESRMVMRVEPLLSGGGQFRWLEVYGEKGIYRGAAVQRLDPVSGQWVRQYTNSTKRPFPRYRVTEFELGRSVWRSFSPGRKRESRLVSEHLPDGLWQRSMSVSEDGGRTWRGLWIDELRRVR